MNILHRATDPAARQRPFKLWPNERPNHWTGSRVFLLPNFICSWQVHLTGSVLWVHATSPGIIGMNITASKTGQHQPQQHSSALQWILKQTDSVTKYHQIRETERDILIKLPDIQLGYIWISTPFFAFYPIQSPWTIKLSTVVSVIYIINQSRSWIWPN